MTDIIDKANDLCEQTVSVAIAKARHAFASREIQPNGFCHNCDEILDNPMAAFCDKDCCDDFEKRELAVSQRPVD